MKLWEDELAACCRCFAATKAATSVQQQAGVLDAAGNSRARAGCTTGRPQIQAVVGIPSAHMACSAGSNLSQHKGSLAAWPRLPARDIPSNKAMLVARSLLPADSNLSQPTAHSVA